MDAKAESAREVELNAKSFHLVSRRDITLRIASKQRSSRAVLRR